MTHYITMGVAGCGKSTVGAHLASKLGLPFFDGDDYHPQSNVEKMSAGIPLNDDDRVPWLLSLVQLMADHPSGTVVSCSALKQAYRGLLREQPVQFVYLEVSIATVLQRVRNRDHFFPESLVRDQFETLEIPSAGEAIHVDGTLTIDAICEAVTRR